MGEKRVRVLVVEDEKDSRVVTTHYLEHLGFEVLTAGDGKQAKETLEKNVVDVVMLDLLMPDFDGFWFLANYPGPIPVVVFSGWSDLRDLPRDPYAMLVKPQDLRDVAVVLRQAAGAA